MTNWHLTGDKVAWTDGFGREWERASWAVFLDAGKQYAVVKNPANWHRDQPMFLIIDIEVGREV